MSRLNMLPSGFPADLLGSFAAYTTPNTSRRHPFSPHQASPQGNHFGSPSMESAHHVDQAVLHQRAFRLSQSPAKSRSPVSWI